MANLERSIEQVLGTRPRTRIELALATGYTGDDTDTLTLALARLVEDGRAVHTVEGWVKVRLHHHKVRVYE